MSALEKLKGFGFLTLVGFVALPHAAINHIRHVAGKRENIYLMLSIVFFAYMMLYSWISRLEMPKMGLWFYLAATLNLACLFLAIFSLLKWKDSHQ